MTHKITVVGGGTAGVMAATYLKSYYGELVDVTMIYDHSKPGIGVGESMTPSFDAYLKMVGVSTIELVQNCNATIKLALQVKDWTHEGSLGYHSFPINEAMHSVDPVLDHYNAVAAYDILTDQFEGSHNYDEFYFDNNLIFGTDDTSYRHALHIDANLVGRYIEDKFKDRINIVDGIVQQVNVKDRRIESIVLESGETYTSDLFIDSSGLAYALIKHLEPEWVNIQDQLPTNRTIPNPVFKDFDYIPPYTSAKATKNGWILDVPLSNRRGCGYVYSSDFQTDEDAKIEFNKWLVETHNVELTSDRVIKYDNGYWKEQYIGNCMAVGLSAGFVEPLEATSIHNVISLMEEFTSMYSLTESTVNNRTYNTVANRVYENSMEYIRYFYHTGRTDSEFWQYMTNNTPAWVEELSEAYASSFAAPGYITKAGMFTSTQYATIGNIHGKFTKAGITRYLDSKFMMAPAKAASANVKKIKLDLRQYAVDHKQWIDYVKAMAV